MVNTCVKYIIVDQKQKEFNCAETTFPQTDSHGETSIPSHNFVGGA